VGKGSLCRGIFDGRAIRTTPEAFKIAALWFKKDVTKLSCCAA
jgi:hypothetical protein